MPRPRAADDFAAIRARMDELRREREEAAAVPSGPVVAPRLFLTTTASISRDNSAISIHLRRFMKRGGVPF